ncbi:MAG: transporter substrate-binding domain-containing protein [Rhodobacteraceae bacterium]|nr:transporter substrate-binding domain-containing protein [Paracoccaceae bacterium]
MPDPFRAVLSATAFTGLSLMAGVAGAEPVRVAYSSWCPHICTDADEVLLPDRPGFAVELVRDALADQGFDVVFQPLPFSRQLQEVSIGRQDAVLHIKRAPDRNYVWPNVPTGTDQQCFVVREDNDWTYSGMDSLEGVSIGAIAGYEYGALSSI